MSIDVHGPLMTKLKAEYAMSMDGKTAYMEMAAASGLPSIIIPLPMAWVKLWPTP